MNHIYKVIFCKATGTFVAVAEFARAHGKKGSGTVGSVAGSESGQAATSRYAMGLSGLTTLSAAIFLSLGLSSTTFAAVGDAICVAEGPNNTVAKDNSPSANLIPLGTGINNSGTFEVACGANATATAAYAVAIGNEAAASGVKSVATGYKAQANSNGAVAIGEEVVGSGISSVAIGAGRMNNNGTPSNTTDDFYEKTIASGLEAIAIGSAATGAGSESIAIGKKASTKVAAGDEQIAQGIAIGASTLVTGTQGIALGNDAQTKGDQAVGIGANTRASGNSSIAIGGDDINKIAANTTSQAKYTNIVGTALIPGSDTVPYTKTESSGAGSIAVGVQSVASGDFATTVGLRSSAIGDASVALGLEANSKDKGTIAIGAVSKAEKAGAVAIGTNSTAKFTNSVALGANSITTDVAPTNTGNQDDYRIAGRPDAKAINATSVVSIGSANNERRITNVAAGRINANSTDGVNGSQLYRTNELVLGGFEIGQGNNGTKVADISPTERLDFVNGTNTTASVTADGTGADVSFNLADKITLTNAGSLTIPSNVSGQNVVLNKDGLNNGGNTITNVAAGAISGTSKDAVNGSQINAITQGNKALLGGATSVIDPVTGVVTSTDIGGTGQTNINDAISTANTQANRALTFTGNLLNDTGADGSQQKLGSTFNISGGAANAAASSNTNVKTVITDGKVDIQLLDAPTFTGQVKAAGFDASDAKIVNVKAGTAATDAANVGQVQDAANAATNKAPVVYTTADGTQVYSTATGFNTAQDGTGDTVLPADIITSVRNANGSTTTATKLSNVANGTADKDAVNFSQLTAVWHGRYGIAS